MERQSFSHEAYVFEIRIAFPSSQQQITSYSVSSILPVAKDLIQCILVKVNKLIEYEEVEKLSEEIFLEVFCQYQ